MRDETSQRGSSAPSKRVRGQRTSVLEVRLVNVLETLGLGDIELLAKELKVLRQLGVVEDLGERLVLGLDIDLLTSENVGELASHVAV